MTNKILLIIVILVIIVVGGILLFGQSFNGKQTTEVNKNQAQNPTPKIYETSKVNVTKSGFEPQIISVKADTAVVWTNTSGGKVTVNSDNHPTNRLWPFLNLGQFDNGQSVSLIFSKPGTYTYHNYLNPSQKGTVIVK